MLFGEEQKRIIEEHLYLDDLGELDGPTVNLELNKRQLRFMLQAVEHYGETMCPLEGKSEECALMLWTESQQTGAIQRDCGNRCGAWLGKLVSETIPGAFPARRRR